MRQNFRTIFTALLTLLAIKVPLIQQNWYFLGFCSVSWQDWIYFNEISGGYYVFSTIKLLYFGKEWLIKSTIFWNKWDSIKWTLYHSEYESCYLETGSLLSDSFVRAISEFEKFKYQRGHNHNKRCEEIKAFYPG